jgi:hypothetical protein
VVNTPEQACQAQALASIAREWPNVLHASFEVVLRGNRCPVYLTPRQCSRARLRCGTPLYRGDPFELGAHNEER